MRRWFWIASAVTGVAMVGCKSGESNESVRPLGNGQEIIVAGKPFDIGTRVVLWDEPGGYNAYAQHCHFKPEQVMPDHPADPSGPDRYSTRKPVSKKLANRVRRDDWTLKNLTDQVDLFVIHYDACGTSRRCFRVLQDMRGLSVQFMLDLDGTIYQTLDCTERAWHAGTANDRSVGIEIANIGAYRDMDTLNEWYRIDDDGRPYVTVPEAHLPTGILTTDFTARPARRERFTGTINNSEVVQYDFTDEQYEALIKLTAGLTRALPNITLQAPREPDGGLINRMLTDEEMAEYHGLLGHWHVWKGKVDPGPAFDWDRVINGAMTINNSERSE